MKNEDDLRRDGAVMCELGNASSRLVAVILCCKEADEPATGILPATPAVFDRHRLYVVRGEAAPQTFTDPVSGETVVEIREATGEFANIGASEIEIGELLIAVGRLAAHTLGRRYCADVIDDDDESLIQSLDDVANAYVVERILVWLDYQPLEALPTIGG